MWKTSPACTEHFQDGVHNGVRHNIHYIDNNISNNPSAASRQLLNNTASKGIVIE